MKLYFYLVLFTGSFIVMPSDLLASVHLDKNNLPRECATCHYKANLRGGGGSTGCLTCHGNPQRRVEGGKMPKGSIVAKPGLLNIEAEYAKTYRHPTFDLPGVHRANEQLPEIDPKAPRHADCVDCHNPHYASKENKFAGIKAKKVLHQVAEATKESEICYRCHGDSANLPGKYGNKRVEFLLTNPSYHPVEGEGKNSNVISLIRPYREKKIASDDISTFSCSECHGSDDVKSPKGVHGSRNQFILVENFNAADNIFESQQAFALCYRCHSRSSILGDESFRFHSLHIQGRSAQQPGTSCFTCHNSHGSTEYKYLLKFNPLVVSPNAKGLLKFVEKGTAKFSGECYLTCHGVDHDPKSY